MLATALARSRRADGAHAPRPQLSGRPCGALRSDPPARERTDRRHGRQPGHGRDRGNRRDGVTGARRRPAGEHRPAVLPARPRRAAQRHRAFPASTPYAVTLDETATASGTCRPPAACRGRCEPGAGGRRHAGHPPAEVLSPGVTGSTQFAVTQFGASFAPDRRPAHSARALQRLRVRARAAQPNTGEPAPTGVYLHYIGPHGSPIRNVEIGITSGPCGSLPLSHLHHLFGFTPRRDLAPAVRHAAPLLGHERAAGGARRDDPLTAPRRRLTASRRPQGRRLNDGPPGSLLSCSARRPALRSRDGREGCRAAVRGRAAALVRRDGGGARTRLIPAHVGVGRGRARQPRARPTSSRSPAVRCRSSSCLPVPRSSRDWSSYLSRYRPGWHSSESEPTWVERVTASDSSPLPGAEMVTDAKHSSPLPADTAG